MEQLLKLEDNLKQEKSQVDLLNEEVLIERQIIENIVRQILQIDGQIERRFETEVTGNSSKKGFSTSRSET